jgi:dTDP-glucose pyrophosphorylase
VKYGLVVASKLTKNMVTIVEKPSLDEIMALEWEHTLSVNMNILTLSYSDTIFKLRNLEPHPVRGEKEITDVFRELAKEGRLKSEIVFESLPDLTSKSDIPKVQKYLEEAYPELQKHS